MTDVQAHVGSATRDPATGEVYAIASGGSAMGKTEPTQPVAARA